MTGIPASTRTDSHARSEHTRTSSPTAGDSPRRSTPDTPFHENGGASAVPAPSRAVAADGGGQRSPQRHDTPRQGLDGDLDPQLEAGQAGRHHRTEALASTSMTSSSSPVRDTRTSASSLPWGVRISESADPPTPMAATSWDSWPWRNSTASAPHTRSTSRPIGTSPTPAAQGSVVLVEARDAVAARSLRSSPGPARRRAVRRAPRPGGRPPCSGTRGPLRPDRCRPRSRPPPAPRPVRRESPPSCGWRWRCRGCPRSRRTPPRRRRRPRLVGSSSSMICMARTLGAPDSVPAGIVARRTSMGPLPGARRPDTCDVRCITWL